jgi:isopentenyl diphosphate isomerase/L-lactate dehydrogenase-like FMN-dependent dehydrogenase
MRPINLREYEVLAETSLAPSVWDYIDSGADDEATLRANCNAYRRIHLRPRVLVNVTACNLRTEALGTPISMPIMVAPTAYQCLTCLEGECATARAAGEAETVMVASTFATCSLEEIAAVSTGPLWFQLYVYRDRSISESLVRRAEASGYQALVLTADTPRLGRRERDIRNGFGLPSHLRRANFTADQDVDVSERDQGASALALHAGAMLDSALTWEALKWLRGVTRLPLLLKGVLTAEDAVLALEHGVDGIIVSNHGGRQLDGVPATIEALPEVVDAVHGHCEVYVDGGIRRGTDVLKAIAFGARAVLVGRPILWGLAVDGASGALHILELLRAELELAMALAGCSDVASIDGSLVGRPA